MQTLFLTAVISFAAGIVVTYLVLRMLLGGAPNIIWARCKGADIEFQVDPNPDTAYAECYGVSSFVDAGPEYAHAFPQATYTHPNANAAQQVTFKIRCYYRIKFGQHYEDRQTNVGPCLSSSSSSSLSSVSSRSSSSSSG